MRILCRNLTGETSIWGKPALGFGIFLLISLKGLGKVFENGQKKSLKVFEFFRSLRLRTL